MKPSVVGFIGCGLLCISFVPQTYAVIKSNKTSDISPYFISLIIITSIIMTIYGFMIKELPIMISNISVMGNNVIILIFVMKNKMKLKNNNIKSQEIINI